MCFDDRPLVSPRQMTLFGYGLSTHSQKYTPQKMTIARHSLGAPADGRLCNAANALTWHVAATLI